MQQQVTRNDSDEAERSERSPFGVVSVANDEKLTGAARQVRPGGPPASGSASQVRVSLSPDGEVRRAQPGPPEPSAGRRCGAYYPPGSLPVLAFKKSSPSGQPCRFLLQCKAEYKTHVRLESGDESPHSKVAVLPYGAGNCRSIPVPIRLRVLRWGRVLRKTVRRRRGKAGIPGDGSPDSRAGKLRRAGR